MVNNFIDKPTNEDVNTDWSSQKSVRNQPKLQTWWISSITGVIKQEKEAKSLF